jgi:hypothetical protein
MRLLFPPPCAVLCRALLCSNVLSCNVLSYNMLSILRRAVLQHAQHCCALLHRAVLCWLQSLQLSGLRVLSSLAAGAAEGELPGEVLVPTSLLDRLLDLIREPATHQEVSLGARVLCWA